MHVTSFFSLALLALAAWTTPILAAGCPPGPFYCLPWGPDPLPTPSPTPIPAPFKPGLMEIKPAAGVKNDELPELLCIQKNHSAISPNDKAQLTKSLGASTKLLDPSAYYLAPKSDGKTVYFKGADLQR